MKPPASSAVTSIPAGFTLSSQLSPAFVTPKAHAGIGFSPVSASCQPCPTTGSSRRCCLDALFPAPNFLFCLYQLLLSWPHGCSPALVFSVTRRSRKSNGSNFHFLMTFLCRGCEPSLLFEDHRPNYQLTQNRTPLLTSEPSQQFTPAGNTPGSLCS